MLSITTCSHRSLLLSLPQLPCVRITCRWLAHSAFVISYLTELMAGARLSSHTFSCQATSVDAMLMFCSSHVPLPQGLASRSRSESCCSSTSGDLGCVPSARRLSISCATCCLAFRCRVIRCRSGPSCGISVGNRLVSNHQVY
jgi:hypothetical protein